MSAAVNGDLPQQANKVARCSKSFTAVGVSVAAGHRITVAGKNSARHGGQLCNAAQVHFCSSDRTYIISTIYTLRLLLGALCVLHMEMLSNAIDRHVIYGVPSK